jgi:hypothetical protein
MRITRLFLSTLAFLPLTLLAREHFARLAICKGKSLKQCALESFYDRQQRGAKSTNRRIV